MGRRFPSGADQDLERRDHRENIIRFGHYMTKARFTRSVGDRREWLSNEDIVTLACGVIVSQRNGIDSHGVSIVHDWMVDEYLYGMIE
jgi:hypothetical protein